MSIDGLDVLNEEAVRKKVNERELGLLVAGYYQDVRQYYADHPLSDNASQERRETYELSMRMSVAARYRTNLQHMIDSWHKLPARDGAGGKV